MRPPDPSSLRPTPLVTGIPATGEVVASDAKTASNAAAQELKNQLQAEPAEWHALYRRFAPAQVWLEGRIAFSHEAQKADLEVKKLELDRKVKEAEQRIAQANADIAALADPSERYSHLQGGHKSALVNRVLSVDRCYVVLSAYPSTRLTAG
jgi:hypothetical protein